MKTTPFTRESGKSNVLLALFVLIAIVVGIVAQQASKNTRTLPDFEKLVVLPKTKPLGMVDFTAHNAQAFHADSLEGKWSILFFAFTNCPDICPSTLHVLKQVKQDLETANAWGAFQIIMISVDPERDTPERMKQYVPFFDPEFIGLTADLNYTEAFAKNLGILFLKGNVLENGAYDVDHGASLILVNPEGEFAGVIGAPHQREDLSTDLIKLGRYALANQKIRPHATLSKNTSASLNTETSIDSNETVTEKATGLSFEHAWIRAAPPNAPAMAGYVDVHNKSKVDVTITGVSSPVFGMTMIHQTIIENSVASMQHLDALTIKAGESLDLAPLGTHLMLMRPKKELPLGTHVLLTLEMASGETVDLSIPILNKKP